MSAQPVLNELKASGFSLFVDGDPLKVSPASKLTDSLRQKIRAHKPEIMEALKAERRREDYTEMYHERAAIAEHDGGLSHQQAEALAIRTVWKWALSSGEGGTYRSDALTCDEARAELERKFVGRKVTNLEFISAMAEGYGFVAYRPEMAEIAQ